MRVTTTRFSTILREPNTRQVIEILNNKIASDTDRQSQFFAACCFDTEGVTDCMAWTFEERMLVLSQYIAAYNTTGSPDFAAGDGKYSDYLHDNPTATPESPEWAQIDGTAVQFKPLTGRMLSVLEGQCTDFASWQIGVIAAMSGFVDDAATEDHAACELRIAARVAWINDLPVSALEQLLQAWHMAKLSLQHYFAWIVTAEGVAIVPKGEGSTLPPTRFCAVDALPSWVVCTFGRSDDFEYLVGQEDRQRFSVDVEHDPNTATASDEKQDVKGAVDA